MANKPKMDFMLNIPTVVTLGNNFKNGQGEYGPWFGWGVVDGQGTEKTLFADSDLQAKLAPFGRGAQLSIIKSQIPGSKQFAWQVFPAGQAPPVAPYAPATVPPIQAPAFASTASQTPNGAQGAAIQTWDREEYRNERIVRAKEAILDAESVLDAAVWSREDVRALAISFLIDEQHKGIAPPDTSF
jgi:hypothetical protein